MLPHASIGIVRQSLPSAQSISYDPGLPYVAPNLPYELIYARESSLLPDTDAVIPARGVYAGFVRFGEKEYAACTNVGVAPTFGRTESRVEAYLLDFEGDLYGRVVDVSFVKRIRQERRFSSVDELIGQIRRDVREARIIADGLG